MKKNLLAFVLVSAALLVSSMALTGCAIEEEEAATSPFEGSWANVDNMVGISTETITFSGDSWTQVSAITYIVSITSTAKGTFTYDEKAKTLTVTVTQASDLSGTLQTLTPPDVETYTYNLSGSTLTLTDSDKETETYTKK